MVLSLDCNNTFINDIQKSSSRLRSTLIEQNIAFMAPRHVASADYNARTGSPCASILHRVCALWSRQQQLGDSPVKTYCNKSRRKNFMLPGAARIGLGLGGAACRVGERSSFGSGSPAPNACGEDQILHRQVCSMRATVRRGWPRQDALEDWTHCSLELFSPSRRIPRRQYVGSFSQSLSVLRQSGQGQ